MGAARLSRHTIYLPPDLSKLAKRRAREEGRSASNVIAEAAGFGLRRKTMAPDDFASRALARVDARLDKIIRDTMLVKECLLLFVRVWLEHNPPLDEKVEDAAAASASARFERFLDYVARSIDAGRSLSASLMAQTTLAEEGPAP